MIHCKSCVGLISAKAKTCPHCGHPVKQDCVFVWFIILVVALPAAWTLMCDGAGSAPSGRMRETPLTPYTQQSINASQLAVLPKLTTLRHDITRAKLQLLLAPACADRSEALELADTILTEVNVLELRVNNGVATATEIAEFGERMKQHTAQSEAIAARLRTAGR